MQNGSVKTGREKAHVISSGLLIIGYLIWSCSRQNEAREGQIILGVGQGGRDFTAQNNKKLHENERTLSLMMGQRKKLIFMLVLGLGLG